MKEQPQQTPGVRVIGRYALHQELAAGGMATVHFGRLLGPAGFSRTVAIKRLHPQFAKDPEFVTMFLDEARLAARIQHPNVVATVDVVATQGELFLVMDYIRGESFSKLMRGSRRRLEAVSVNVIAGVTVGMLHGLHAAHEAKDEQGQPLKVVHRDVSPQNLLVGVDGVARVLDFGVAKAAARAQVTRDGQMKGKLSYMAPEQLKAERVDRRADVFATGVVLWEALTGRRLFDSGDGAKVLKMILGGAVLVPSKVNPSVPEAVDDIVMKALQRDASDRYQTAREFAIALEEAVTLASPREIGEWVERIAGEVLVQREQTVAAIEAGSSVSRRIALESERVRRRSDSPKSVPNRSSVTARPSVPRPPPSLATNPRLRVPIVDDVPTSIHGPRGSGPGRTSRPPSGGPPRPDPDRFASVARRGSTLPPRPNHRANAQDDASSGYDPDAITTKPPEVDSYDDITTAYDPAAAPNPPEPDSYDDVTAAYDPDAITTKPPEVDSYDDITTAYDPETPSRPSQDDYDEATTHYVPDALPDPANRPETSNRASAKPTNPRGLQAPKSVRPAAGQPAPSHPPPLPERTTERAARMFPPADTQSPSSSAPAAGRSPRRPRGAAVIERVRAEPTRPRAQRPQAAELIVLDDAPGNRGAVERARAWLFDNPAKRRLRVGTLGSLCVLLALGGGFWAGRPAPSARAGSADTTSPPPEPMPASTPATIQQTPDPSPLASSSATTTETEAESEQPRPAAEPVGDSEAPVEGKKPLPKPKPTKPKPPARKPSRPRPKPAAASAPPEAPEPPPAAPSSQDPTEPTKPTPARLPELDDSLFENPYAGAIKKAEQRQAAPTEPSPATGN